MYNDKKLLPDIRCGLAIAENRGRTRDEDEQEALFYHHHRDNGSADFFGGILDDLLVP